MIAIITENEDVSLVCTTSLLRLQQLSSRREDIALDVHFVPTLLDALNIGRGDYIVAVDAQCGFPAEFVFGVVESKHKAVAGVYPLPRVDWERVTKTLGSGSKEPMEHAGNVYNLTPEVSGMHRYLEVKKVEELRVLAIATSVLKNMQCDKYGDKYLYCHESVHNNAYQNPTQTLARKLPKDVRLMADIEAPCVLSAPAQFAGCIGMRGFVR